MLLASSLRSCSAVPEVPQTHDFAAAFDANCSGSKRPRTAAVVAVLVLVLVLLLHEVLELVLVLARY
jgi:hypothetical protein